MNKLFLIILMILVGQSSIAQQNTQNFNVALHGGINFANLTNTDDTDARIGLNLGAYASYRFDNSIFGVRTGLNYSQQGAKEETSTVLGGDVLVDIDAIVKLDYLQIPLLLEIEASPGLFFTFGPQVGFVVNDELELSGSDVDTETSDIFNEQSTTISAVIGGQFFVADGFFVRAQYDFGLSKVYRDVNFPSEFGPVVSSSNDFKHKVFTLSVGIEF